MTDIFPVKYGVKQGCKMSPTLYSVYINDLADDIRALSAGVELDELNISSLLYADDVALIAPDEQNLQRKLDCNNSWCLKWRMTINKDKTKIIHF